MPPYVRRLFSPWNRGFVPPGRCKHSNRATLIGSRRRNAALTRSCHVRWLQLAVIDCRPSIHLPVNRTSSEDPMRRLSALRGQALAMERAQPAPLLEPPPGRSRHCASRVCAERAVAAGRERAARPGQHRRRARCSRTGNAAQRRIGDDGTAGAPGTRAITGRSAPALALAGPRTGAAARISRTALRQIRIMPGSPPSGRRAPCKQAAFEGEFDEFHHRGAGARTPQSQ